MNVVHLDRSDATVDSLIRTAFPGYTGRKIKAIVTDRIRFYGTNWDEGNKRDYSIVRLADMARYTISDAPFMSRSALHDNDHELAEGFVVVVHVYYRGGELVEIHSRPENVNPLLPAPIELSEDEQTVLVATRSLKSSYGGIKNYRFHEARDRTGITLPRWDAAKAALIEKKFLNGAGAITTTGRNAIGQQDFPPRRPVLTAS